jgi:hypothetical protein
MTTREWMRRLFTRSGNSRRALPLPGRTAFRPGVEILENRTVPSAVTFSTVTAQPTGALSSGTYVDVPGLVTTAAAGLFNISASVDVQNTAATAATEVGVELLVNSAVVDTRVLTFAPSSNTFEKSLTVEADVTLTANEKIEVQATVLGSSGSAQFPGSTQTLRLIQFNSNPDSSPGAVFTNVTALPATALSSSAFSDVPGLTTPTPAGGLYHVSASVNVQNNSTTAATQIGVELLANSQVVDARVLSFAANSPTAQQSISVEADLALAANETLEVQTMILGAGGSAQYPGTTQTLRLIQFKSNPDHTLGAAFTAVTAAPTTALSSNAYIDVPGLATAATVAGNYRLSASVDLQNTSTTSATQVGVQLVANGQVLESRVVSFGPNSNTFEQSITVEANVALTANENVEVQATVLGTGGSAQYPGTTQTLHMIQFIPPPVTTVAALVADFPGNGVWRHSDTAGWLQLSPAEASLVDVDDHGNVAAVFANGLWRYEDSAGWQNLSPAIPSLIDIAGNGIVVGEFPGNGVWRYGSALSKTESWVQLTPANAVSVAVDDQGDTAGSFQGNGVFLYQDTGGWQLLTPAVATQVSLAPSGGSLAASFGNGVWRYTLQASGGVSVGWLQVSGQTASGLAVDSAGGVLCALHDGLWLFPQTGTGQQLTPALPTQLGITSDGQVFAEFSGNGVWEYNSGWQQVTPANAKWLR